MNLINQNFCEKIKEQLSGLDILIFENKDNESILNDIITNRDFLNQI